MLYLIARRLLARAGAAAGEPALSAGAVFAALLFAVHPLRVESVVWITERRDVQGAFFFLLSVWGYLYAVAGGRDGRLTPLGRGLSIAAFAAALLSKASTMMLPAALLVLDVYPLRRLAHGWRRLLTEKLPYFALAAVDQRPDRPDARAALATALVKRAEELRREGRPREADGLAGESEALAPDRPSSR